MSTKRYAEGTSVPIEKTKAELERLLTKHNAEQVAVMSDNKTGESLLVCKLGGRMLRFEVLDPDPNDFQKTPAGRRREKGGIAREVAAERRRRWRALLLILKAKLEIIASGDSSIDREFLGSVYLPSGETMEQAMRPHLDAAYSTGKMPALPMLPGRTS